MNWLLAGLVAYVAIKAVISYRKGFARMLLALSAALLSLILVWLFAPAVRDFLLEHTDAKETIAARLDPVLLEHADTITGGLLPADQALLPDALADMVREKAAGYAAEGVHGVSLRIAGVLISAASYGLLYLFLWLALRILGYVLHLVTRLPVLRQVNGLMGLVLGLTEAYILICVLFILITAFSHTDTGFALMKMIGQSELLSFIYNNNLLLQLIGG